MTSKKTDPSLPGSLVACVKALDDKKAFDLRLLEIRDQSSIADFMLICTGTSKPHLRALRKAVNEVADIHTTRYRGAPDDNASGWIALDAFDFIIHLFTRETREFYRLEQLWRDAREIDVQPFLEPDDGEQ